MTDTWGTYEDREPITPIPAVNPEISVMEHHDTHFTGVVSADCPKCNKPAALAYMADFSYEGRIMKDCPGCGELMIIEWEQEEAQHE